MAIHESILPALFHTIELCLGPSVFMLMMSFAIFVKAPSSTFVNAMQHFGGGIVLSAVATELLPAMSKQKHSWQNTVATLIGFFAGVAMMVGVAHFCGEPEEDEEDKEEEEEEEEEEEGEKEEGKKEEGMEKKRQQALPHDLLPAMHKASSLSVGKVLSPSFPPSLPPSPLIGRSGMVRAPTLSRRRSLMETYRQAALAQSCSRGASSPLLMRRAVTVSNPRAVRGPSFQSPPSPSSRPRPSSSSVDALDLSVSSSSSSHPTKRMAKSKTANVGRIIFEDNTPSSSLLPSLPSSTPPTERTSLLPPSSSTAAALENGELDRGLAALPPSPSPYAPPPWTLIIPVYVDSLMDGLLIGLAAVAGQSAGLVMSIALTIEMGFLGLTFSAGVSKVEPVLRYALVVGAPLMILVGGTVGALAAALLAANPTYQVGLLSFGAASLLYLITEELLVEAHEEGGPHVWYVDIMFFVGFIASVLLEQNIQDASGKGA